MSLDQHTIVIQSNETGVRELAGPSVWGAGAGKELSRRPWNEGTMSNTQHHQRHRRSAMLAIEPQDRYHTLFEPPCFAAGCGFRYQMVMS
jgi:hypothetical protein